MTPHRPDPHPSWTPSDDLLDELVMVLTADHNGEHTSWFDCVEHDIGDRGRARAHRPREWRA